MTQSPSVSVFRGISPIVMANDHKFLRFTQDCLYDMGHEAATERLTLPNIWPDNAEYRRPPVSPDDCPLPRTTNSEMKTEDGEPGDGSEEEPEVVVVSEETMPDLPRMRWGSLRSKRDEANPVGALWPDPDSDDGESWSCLLYTSPSPRD